MTTDDDTRLLDDLRDLWSRTDPPPAGLSAAMIAAVAAAGLDDEWELLVLVRDSADEPAAHVRGLSTARVLYFNAVAGWSLEAEIDGNDVRGQLLDFDGDMGSVEVVVDTTDGQSWTTALDEVGFFVLTGEPTGSVRFTVRAGGRSATSRWIEL